MLSNIDSLVAELLAGRAYRAVAPELARTLLLQELPKRRKRQELLKEVRRRLHQLCTSYVKDGQRAVREMVPTTSSATIGKLERDQLFSALRAQHVSTSEREPFLPEFYRFVSAHCQEVQSVLDLGCGFHPLAFERMCFSNLRIYHALDVHLGLLATLELLLAPLLEFRGIAADALTFQQPQEYDLVFALKLLPLLEQIRKGSARTLLQQLRARWLVVSFPTQSRSGQGRGMHAYYSDFFENSIESLEWQILARQEFPNELCFVLQRAGRVVENVLPQR
jgi:hypothetical protein